MLAVPMFIDQGLGQSSNFIDLGDAATALVSVLDGGPDTWVEWTGRPLAVGR
jgi:hypothetical protein